MRWRRFHAFSGCAWTGLTCMIPPSRPICRDVLAPPCGALSCRKRSRELLTARSFFPSFRSLSAKRPPRCAFPVFPHPSRLLPTPSPGFSLPALFRPFRGFEAGASTTPSRQTRWSRKPWMLHPHGGAGARTCAPLSALRHTRGSLPSFLERAFFFHRSILDQAFSPGSAPRERRGSWPSFSPESPEVDHGHRRVHR